MSLRWYVVHTQPHAELQAETNLVRQGYSVYLPRYVKTRRHARKVETVQAALFPRYLFVALDSLNDQWRPIRSTIGVSDILRNGDALTPVPVGVVEDIQSHETSDGLIDVPSPNAFRKGDKIVVERGAFADHVGIFDAVTDQQRVSILLSLLGREVRVVLPGRDVYALA